jgi:hypothetical protein
MLNARSLAVVMGKQAKQVNALLREHGYLEGFPGQYWLTDKGRPYAQEQDHGNGYGGYAARSWTTRQWDPVIVDLLTADIAAAERADHGPEPVDDRGDAAAEEAGPPLLRPQVLAGAAVLAVVAGALAVPRSRRWVLNRATRAWARLTGSEQPSAREQLGAGPDDPVEADG